MRCAYCALHGLRNGEFRNIGEFVEPIEHHVTVRNKVPKPFVWTALPPLQPNHPKFDRLLAPKLHTRALFGLRHKFEDC